jgi:predicted nucleic acid-binding protein
VTPGQGLLDTSTFILLRRIADRALLPAEALITTVTMGELSVGPLVAATTSERTARQQRLQQAATDFDPIPFDAEAARAFAHVAASLRESGRKASARAFDALIAATAMSRGLPLHTCNPRDFAGISGLEVIAVPHPDAP